MLFMSFGMMVACRGCNLIPSHAIIANIFISSDWDFFFSADCQPSSSVLVFEAPQLGDSLAAQRELRDIVEIHPFEQCFVAMRRDKSAIFWGRDQEPQVFRDVTKVGVTKRGLAALKLFCISEKFYFVSHDVHRPLRSAVLRPFGCVRTETIAL